MNLNFTLKLYMVGKSLTNKTYLVCKLKPSPSCKNQVYKSEPLNLLLVKDQLDQELIKNETTHTCDSNSKVFNYFEKNSKELQTKSLILANLNSLDLNKQDSFNNYSFNNRKCESIFTINKKKQEIPSPNTVISVNTSTVDPKNKNQASINTNFNNRFTISILALLLVIITILCLLVVKNSFKNFKCKYFN